MTKTLLVAAAAIAVVAFAPTAGFAKSSPALVTNSDLLSICRGNAGVGDQNAMLDLGNGKSLAVTVHCNRSDALTVGSNTDTGESEMGSNEAAENGVED